MNINTEKLTKDLISEMSPILIRNYKESGHMIEDLDICWDSYLSVSSCFTCIIMRDDDAIISGILLFLISPYSHVKSLICAQQVTFFIDKLYRGSSRDMISFSEELFKSLGVDFIIQSARYNTHFCGTLGKLGYEPTDLAFMKRI